MMVHIRHTQVDKIMLNDLKSGLACTIPEHRTLITIKKFKKIKKNNIFFDFLKSKKNQKNQKKNLGKKIKKSKQQIKTKIKKNKKNKRNTTKHRPCADPGPSLKHPFSLPELLCCQGETSIPVARVLSFSPCC